MKHLGERVEIGEVVEGSCGRCDTFGNQIYLGVQEDYTGKEAFDLYQCDKCKSSWVYYGRIHKEFFKKLHEKPNNETEEPTQENHLEYLIARRGAHRLFVRNVNTFIKNQRNSPKK